MSSERTPARVNLVSGKREAATFRPELVFALGPQLMGAPGDGDYLTLHRNVWAMAWHGFTGLTLYQRQGEQWVVVTPGKNFPDLGATVRHISLAFDQSARHVAAWEDDGQLLVRQWDQTEEDYVYRGPFPGVDPVLVNDATAMFVPSASDVLLLYLNAARTELRYRAQRDAYLVERTLLTGLVDAVLDQVVALPYRLEIMGESEHLPFYAQTPLYPIRVTDLLPATGTMVLSLYEAMLIEQSSVDTLNGIGKMLTSTYESVEAKAVLTEPLAGVGKMLTSAYDLTLRPHGPVTDPLSGAGTLVSTSKLENVGVPRTLTEGLTGAGALIGGTYAP
ncbi:hypothetical protein [Deinococcus sp. QL22]|uniref:hypothetical protein n=1 Tax=Deinococcus sp. QL22 TaxID=2939437 RepID=UPI00201819DB|nr:hypothetical protein [Deinococcus sp. QL22]UQN06754.1 hypothetical protein M1R55_02195 [Deinococcus sp. QL22]